MKQASETVGGVVIVPLVHALRGGAPTAAITAFPGTVGMSPACSSNHGLTLGFVFYPVIKPATGRRRDVRSPLFVATLLIVVWYCLP